MDDLPDEIISSILEYLDPVSKLRTSLVNRRFYEIATDPVIHRSAAFRTCDYLPGKTIATYLKKYGSSLRSLDLQDCYWLAPCFMSVIQISCSHLTSLNLLGCMGIPVKVIVTIFKKNCNLRHFGWTVGMDLLLKLKNINSGEGQHGIEQINGLGVLFENLTSLKLGLSVYSVTAYRDAFNPEAAFFVQFISRIISPKLKTLTVICLERLELMIQPKQSRVLLELQVELEELDQDSNTVSVMSMKNCFAQVRNELATAAISEHDGVIKGWLKYVLSQNLFTVKSLHVAGSPFLNFWIPLLGNGLTSCEISEIKSLDISSSHDVPLYWLMSVLRANSLTFLNVSNMECVTSYLLELISEVSPCLESLNVKGCHDCLDPIGGLKSIATRCHQLRHLNIGRIHHHTTGSNSELFEILSSMKYLISISLSGCSIIPCKFTQDQEIKMDKEEEVEDTSTSEDQLSDSCCHDSRNVHNDGDIEEPSCLQTFTKSCTFLRQIEIINVGFHSVLRKGPLTSRLPPGRAQLIWDCPDNDSKFLEALFLCTGLEKLTLAGVDVRGGLEFLFKIAASCKRLSFLSLAQLRSLELVGTLPMLNKALSCFTQLKQFRFEQSYFAVPRSFAVALFNLTHLESLCIITKGGSIAVSTIIPLFEKCQKLRVLQICADASSSEETFRNLTNILYNRYSNERPGLAVCLFPYDSNTRDLHNKLFNHAHENSFPLVHLKSLSLFGSEVATRIC